MPNPTGPSKNPWLRMRPLPRAIGVVMLVVGAVWVLQGIGIAKGSVMTGNGVWAVIGTAFIVAGAVILRRGLNQARDDIAADDEATPPPPVI